MLKDLLVTIETLLEQASALADLLEFGRSVEINGFLSADHEQPRDMEGLLDALESLQLPFTVK